jgi:hypothetical protein
MPNMRITINRNVIQYLFTISKINVNINIDKESYMQWDLSACCLNIP